MQSRRGLTRYNRRLSRPHFRLMVCVMALVLLCSFLLPNRPAFADDEDEHTIAEFSLYQRASEISREFGTALAPGSGRDGTSMVEDANGKWIKPGNAGGFIGYTDVMSDDKGLLGWLTSSFTTASSTITYDQLKNIINGGQNNPFYLYAGYGEALKIMGLSKTIRANGMDGLGRLIPTLLMMIAYLIANAAPFLFRIALWLLNVLNPFNLFMGVIDGVSGVDAGILSTAANYVGEIYKTIQNFSVYALLPMFLASTMLGAVWIRKKGSASKRFARYGLRVFMLFAGLPLIGATYTGVIKDLGNTVSSGSDYANYLVTSSYVDFENWARNSRLAVPEGAKGKIIHPRYATGSENEKMRVASRDLVLSINADGAKNKAAERVEERYKTTNISDVFKEGGKYRDNVDKRSTWDSGNDGARGNFREVFDLLSRHLGTDTYSGAEYDGEVAGMIQRYRNKHPDAEEEIVKMYSLTASENRLVKDAVGDDYKDADWAKDTVDWGESKGLFGSGGKDIFEFKNVPYNIYNAGDLKYSTKDGFTSTTTGFKDAPLSPVGKSAKGTVGGLSPLAMYNFLNTTFNETGLTVFSPQRSTSDTTRDAYASVTFASSGVIAVTRWTEDIVIMLCVSVLAISFGIMMIAAAVKNIPRILTSVFGTALGSIAFVTKLLISTGVMIIQILGMIFLYALSEDIIMSLLMGFDKATTFIGKFFGTSGMLLDFSRSFLLIVITLTVTIFMIRNAKVFREMLEEVVSNAINRVMGLLDTSTGGKGLDIATTTGGRIGRDGHLTDEAKNGSPKGIAGLLADAHDLESRREQLAEERGLEKGGLGSMIANRAKTAKDLLGADAKDKMKNLVGINGKSLEREKDAKEREINSMPYNNDSLEDYANSRGLKGLNGDEKAVNTTASGQQIDDDGNVITDEYGNAFDADGNPISAETPLATGMGGFQSVTDGNGALLDQDGNAFTDEAGNIFYENEDGDLVNGMGQYVALDNDGVLRPTDKPVKALSEAKKLNKMRYNPKDYANMKQNQNATHYGLDADGNIVDSKGRALHYRDKDGQLKPLQLDENGFVVDADGNRIDAKQLANVVDPRGFEEVTDPNTGETHLRHKGDEAMKLADDQANANANNGKPQSLSALAKQANRAEQQAEQAEKRVEALKASGASDYAIAQAERYAERAKANAESAQQRFNQAMTQGGHGRIEPVTQEQVKSANRFANQQKQKLVESQHALEDMKARGASPEAIAKQEQVVQEQKKSYQQTVSALKDAERNAFTPQQVLQQQQAVEQARDNLSRSQERLQKLQSQNANRREIDEAKRDVAQAKAMVEQHQEKLQSMMQANQDLQQKQQAVKEQQQTLKQAENRLNNMRKPKASPQEIARQEQRVEQQRLKAEEAQKLAYDTRMAQKTGRSFSEVTNARQRVDRAEAHFEKAQTAFNQAVESGQPPQVIAKRQQALNKASNILTKAQANYERVKQAPVGTRSQIDKATARYEQAKQQYAQATNKVLQLEEANKPITQQQVAQAQQMQSQAQTKMLSTRKGHTRYQQAQQQHQQATVELKEASQKVNELKQSGASPQEVQQAQQRVQQAQQKVSQSQQTMDKWLNQSTQYKRAEKDYKKATQTVERYNRQQAGEPAVPEKEIQRAKREQRQAQRKMEQAKQLKHTLLSPKNWGTQTQKAPIVQDVPTTSPTRSYAKLASKGISNYADYSKEVRSYTQRIADSQSRLKRAQQHLAMLQRTGRPPQDIQKAQSQVQQLKQSIQNNQANLKELQDNAHGLLKNGGFTPPVATRPIRQNGGMIINQLVNMSHTQAMYDKLAHQEKEGTITERGKTQMAELDTRLKDMRSDLIKAGIRENALQDRQSIAETTKHMQQSWTAFLEGKSTEYEG